MSLVDSVHQMATEVDFTLVVPVYNNYDTLPALLRECQAMAVGLRGTFEVVFVVDGGSDDSFNYLSDQLPVAGFRCRLITHSRNFGSFAAIRTGLESARGAVVAVRSADLQEPRELVEQLFSAVRPGSVEVAMAVRQGRQDPRISRLQSGVFWWFYRRLVQPSMPPGGIDIFACTANVRDELVRLHEANSSLVGLLVWLGHRCTLVPYERAERVAGRSGWTMRKKLKYLADSSFAFSRTPIAIIRWIGFGGVAAGMCIAFFLIVMRIAGRISVSGYTPIMLAVVILGSLNLAAIGTIGSYLWRAFENTKNRPLAVVETTTEFQP